MAKTIHHGSWVLIFGSNRAGRHGAGAALTAARHYGAESGVGEGLMGQSYALPTKDAQLNVLPLDEIREGVDRLIGCVRIHPTRRFQLTPIGTGLSGYADQQIAPLFELDELPTNLMLPQRFKRVLRQSTPYRIIVAGSRNFADRDLLFRAVGNRVNDLRRFDSGLEINIVSGTAAGADSLGEDFARSAKLPCLRMPADWDRFGKAAGHLRNEAMAWCSDELIAFWDGKSTGTQGMIKIAERENMVRSVFTFSGCPITSPEKS